MHLQGDLAMVYDYVAPCFPPSYNIFESMFQLHHVHVATVIDTLGQYANKLSNGGALKIMEFIRKYMVRKLVRYSTSHTGCWCLSVLWAVIVILLLNAAVL